MYIYNYQLYRFDSGFVWFFDACLFPLFPPFPFLFLSLSFSFRVSPVLTARFVYQIIGWIPQSHDSESGSLRNPVWGGEGEGGREGREGRNINHKKLSGK